MDLHTAFNNIVLVARDFKGTWQQHVDLEASLKALHENLNWPAPVEAPPEEPVALPEED